MKLKVVRKKLWVIKKKDGYEIKNISLVWSMECGKGQVLGFTTEALGFMSGTIKNFGGKNSFSQGW